MKSSCYTAAATFGVLAGAAVAQPQLTVLDVTPGGPVRGTPYYAEPAATGDVAYLLNWDPDPNDPGAGWYVLVEWRRSTNSFRHISTGPMLPSFIGGMSHDGGTMAHYADTSSGSGWSRWTVASGSSTNVATHRPWAMNESLSPYITRTRVSGDSFFPAFVLADNSLVDFPASGYVAALVRALLRTAWRSAAP